MNLHEFLAAVPMDWVLAPIYKKGAPMKSGKSATGKNPFEPSFEKPFNKHDATLAIEKNPTLTAVGLFTGIRGNGYVILDVDKNLGVLKRKFGDTLNGAPVIESTRANAAKYIFKVPEELWGEVSGFSHSDEHADGYEVLFGAQGLVFGAYPGSNDGKWPAGVYGFEGDPDVVPVAPDWLLAEMKAAKKTTGFLKNKTALDLSDRTEDEVAEIINDCLSVIDNRGSGQREHWVKIGMAIHSVLPNEKGLELWSDWSRKDGEFADEWERGNPCQNTWNSFKPGSVGLGSLIWQADRADPKRTRFDEKTRSILETAEAAKVLEWRNTVLTHSEVVKQAKEILLLDNPSEINHRMNGLAVAAGYRDKAAIEQLLMSQLEYERKSSAVSWKELSKEEFNKDFLIPDILPHPSVVLIYGAGGDGKSMTSWVLAKHVATGSPFLVRGQLVPVKQGPVLILNGDQPKVLLQEQLAEIDLPEDAPVTIQTGFQLKEYSQFCRYMDEYKPSLVIIDSLIGCSSADSFDENKSSFASPLYWLTKNNGELFPATTILIIHHANKTGGFRGTSSIRDAVDETWALKKPDGGINSLPLSSRLITIEKSRSGRSGTSLIMNMEADLSFSVADFTKEIDETKTTPDGIVDRVLMKVRTIYPRTATREDLNSDPLVGGRVSAIKKSLQRLVKKGLIEEGKEEGRYGKKHYKAVLARGEGGGECPPSINPVTGTPPRGDNEGGQKDCPLSKSRGDTAKPEKDDCPPSETSTGAASAQGGQPDKYPHARTEEEVNAAIDQSVWD